MTMLFGSAHLLSGLYDITETTVVASTTSSKQLVSADPNRIFLFFVTPSGSTAVITTKSNPAIGTGIPMPQQGFPLTFTIHDNPALVQAAWYFPQQASAVSVTVITISEHPIDAIHYE